MRGKEPCCSGVAAKSMMFSSGCYPTNIILGIFALGKYDDLFLLGEEIKQGSYSAVIL